MTMQYVLPLLAITGSLCAVEINADVTPRLSLGVAKGLGLAQSEVDSLASSLASLGSPSVSYETKAGVNAEVPVVFAFKGSAPVYFIAAPAFVYAQNTNNITADVTTIHMTGDDKYTQIGGKLYAGIGFGGSNGFHGEVLPYIGMASVSEDVKLSATNSANGMSTNSTSSYSGNVTLYGVTFGAYYAPNITKGIEFGGRLGYVGASGKVSDTKVDQSGALIAVEIGWKI